MMRLMNSCPSSSQLYLSIVVPVYRSEGCLNALINAIAEALTPGVHNYEVVLINDCSPDESWKIIESLCQGHPNILGVDLRRNFGQDNAILTGLRLARGQYIVIMDDDLQHHPKDIPDLLRKIEEGWDVVYADFRVKRQKLWKNIGSWFNGKVAGWVIDKPKEIYLSPYKVISKEVAELLCDYFGSDPYIDGLLLQVTSRITQIPVEHCSRYAGQSTYTVWKSLRVWARLAFSFSTRPLRLVSWFGLIFAAFGLLLAVAVIIERIFFPEHFAATDFGWASLMVSILCVGGTQLFFLGVLGEYAGRTYLRVNNKPQTAIRQILNANNRENLHSELTERDSIRGEQWQQA